MDPIRYAYYTHRADVYRPGEMPMTKRKQLTPIDLAKVTAPLALGLVAFEALDRLWFYRVGQNVPDALNVLRGLFKRR